MGNTKAGGIKVAETNKRLYGDDYYVKIGALGGKIKNKNKGFGSNRELAKIAGSKGGKKRHEV
jgi:hypothetical protein